MLCQMRPTFLDTVTQPDTKPDLKWSKCVLPSGSFEARDVSQTCGKTRSSHSHSFVVLRYRAKQSSIHFELTKTISNQAIICLNNVYTFLNENSV